MRRIFFREFKPVSKGSAELVGTWDIVLGSTPEEPEARRPGGPGGPGRGRNRPGGPPPGEVNPLSLPPPF